MTSQNTYPDLYIFRRQRHYWIKNIDRKADSRNLVIAMKSNSPQVHRWFIHGPQLAELQDESSRRERFDASIRQESEWQKSWTLGARCGFTRYGYEC